MAIHEAASKTNQLLSWHLPLARFITAVEEMNFTHIYTFIQSRSGRNIHHSMRKSKIMRLKFEQCL